MADHSLPEKHPLKLAAQQAARDRAERIRASAITPCRPLRRVCCKCKQELGWRCGGCGRAFKQPVGGRCPHCHAEFDRPARADVTHTYCPQCLEKALAGLPQGGA
jgi:hypothetical protein